MKIVHVECDPDEALAKKLGFTRKQIIHHQGKSRIFLQFKQARNQLAIVDEDPGSPKTTYERNLRFVEEANGIKFFIDASGNKVLMLKGRLEDWLIGLCRKEGIKPTDYGLPDKPKDLHDVINQKINKVESLLDYFIEKKVKGIYQLKNWLEQ